MLLRHVHLRGLTHYNRASVLQDQFVARLLEYKADPSRISQPDPVIITAEFHPVYTCGRREIGTVSPQQRAYLTEPTPWGRAEFYEALRGGQTTFHGPGQLIAYPVLDLKRHKLSPRCYVRLLEKSVIELLQRRYNIRSMTTDNPGVWVNQDDKICALGVHLRRNVSSHGIGLNLSTETGWFERIVACGLEGKRTVSIEKVLGQIGSSDMQEDGVGFVGIMAQGLEGVTAIATVESETVD